MFHIHIITFGKHKESWLIDALCEYEKRLSPFVRFSWKFCKNNQDLFSALQAVPFYICLDSKGKDFTSEEFSRHFLQQLEKKKSRLYLAIGGSEGLSPEILQQADELWSFSKMTLTHQQVRLLLLEQIYRAFEIAKGSKYHK